MKPTRFLYPFLLSVISLISFLQLFKGYFWLDDYTYLYYAQQHLPVRSYAFPYNFGVSLADQLYKIFGLEHAWYLILAISFYISAVLFVYFFISSITKNNKIGFLSSLVAAGGYVGQASLAMVIGDGLYVLLGLNMMLLSLTSLYKYLKEKRNFFLVLSLISFFLAMEFAPTRFGGLFFAMIAFDLIFSRSLKRISKGFVKRSTLFFIVFLAQYLIHPTKFILNYQVNDSNLLPRVQLNYLINPLGTFWNIFFPTTIRDQIIYFLKNSGISHFINNIFFYALPSVIFAILILGLIKLLKGSELPFKKFIRVCFFMAATSLLWGFIVIKFIAAPIFQMSAVNGGILLTLLIALLFLKIPRFPKLSIFSLALSIGLFTVFVLFKPERMIESDDRYLLSLSFIQPFVMSFFVTRELFRKNNGKSSILRKKIIAWVILLLPVLFLIISHFLLAIYSQHKDYLLYSKDRSNIFNQLKIQIPNISQETSIYVEGATKPLNYSVGDAFRVGTLKSNASVAVNYKTILDNIILPEKTGDLPQILKNNLDLDIKNVFTFIYDGNKLKDTSSEMRRLLLTTSPTSNLEANWKVEPLESLVQQNNYGVNTKTTFYSYLDNTLGIYPQIFIYPKQRISTLLPLKIQLRLKGDSFASLPSPYYHLHYSESIVPSKLWQEVLSWRIGQCSRGDYVKPFECVLDESLARSLTQDAKKTGKVEISWKYNTYGLLSQPKKIDFDISLDGQFHDYQFTIPVGGEYLKEIEVNYISFPGFLSVNDLKFNYIK